MKSYKQGFTLLELLVALTLFSVVALMGTSAILIIIGANSTSQSVSSVLSNLSLSLEGMSRNIRVGSIYHCGDYSSPVTALDCSNTTGSNPSLTFLTENGTDWFTYKKNGTTINKYLNGVDQGSIIAPEITVQTLNFYVSGAQNATQDPPNKTQPMVIIVITGYVDNGQKGQVPFNIQTTVSERLIL